MDTGFSTTKRKPLTRNYPLATTYSMEPEAAMNQRNPSYIIYTAIPPEPQKNTHHQINA
jgi:hypothetical protein